MRQTEVEANTDVLPLSVIPAWSKRATFYLQPLPPREKDSKPHLPVPRSSRRTMTPIELDATEAERLSSTVLQRVCSNKSHKQSDAGLTASSPSPTLSKNLQAVVLGDQQPDGASGKGTIKMTDSTEKRYTGNLRPQILEGMDFLDLASTGSGEAEDRIPNLHATRLRLD